MYYSIVMQLIQSLTSLQRLLDKAERHAAVHGFEVDQLMARTLAADMKPLSYQVTSACNYVKQAAGWLSGTPLPVHDDTETTVAQLRERVTRTVEFAAGIPRERFEGAAHRTMSYSWKPNHVMDGETYVLQMAIPNVFFHVAMVYAILRNNGVDVGKMDYLEPLRFAAA